MFGKMQLAEGEEPESNILQLGPPSKYLDSAFIHGPSGSCLDTRINDVRVKGASIMLQQRRRGNELLIEARVRAASACTGRGRPDAEPLRMAMKAEQDRAGTAREA